MLRQAQPRGPYLLGGWSLGGVVAFEMARQLSSQGEVIALLALFDPSSPSATAASEEEGLALLGDFAQQLGLAAESFAPQMEHIRQLDPDTQLRYLLEQVQQARVLPPDVTPAQLRRRLGVFAAHRRALDGYVPRYAPQHITLFPARERLAQELPDPAKVWSRLADGVEIHSIPGDHYTILRPPHVQILAERLHACLDTLPEPLES